MSSENPDEPVVWPITDVLDLHTVPPRDVRDVVEAWLAEVKNAGFVALRIIHGKGVGVQREMVRQVLTKDPDVDVFSDAPMEAGGWGATVVTLKRTRECGEPLPVGSPGNSRS